MPRPPRTNPKSAAKVQRWIDLVSTLLVHRFPLTFLELARHVPAYLADGSVAAGEPSDTLKRMFERDKDELKAFGVPIEKVGENGDEESRYQLPTRDFYLPYLLVASQRGTARPRRVERYGYRELEVLAFEPDELVAIAEGAARARQLGDPTLAADVDSALRKLAVDLPLGAASAGDGTYLAPVRARPDPRTLEMLGDALFRRKRATMTYHSMGHDVTARRTVEPYGLFFLNGHWYLVARDAEKGALRNFRVSRVADVAVNEGKKGTPDYEIPSEFRLREHARSRQAWELGDDDALEAVVELRGDTGAVVAARALGRPIEGHPERRAFSVRRADAFARWLLSFAGDAVPVAPAAIVDEYRRQVARTRELYTAGGVA